MICKCPQCKKSYTIEDSRKGEIFCCLECGMDFILDNKNKRRLSLYLFFLVFVLASLVVVAMAVLKPKDKSTAPSNVEEVVSDFDRGVELIKKNDFIILSRFLKTVDINCCSPEGSTLLIYCVQNKDLVTAQFLLGLGADANLEDSENMSAVHYAVLNNDVPALEELLAREAKITDTRNPLISIAVEKGHVAVLKLLLSANRNFRALEVMSGNQKQAIFLAIYNKQSECISLLLDKYDLNSTRDLKGNTMLHAAVATKNLPLVRLLIKRGAHLNVKNGMGDSPFMVAAKVNSPELIAAVANDKIDYQEVNAKGETVAMVAASNSNMQLLEKSLNASNIDSVDKEGRSVLYYACLSGNNSILDFVLDKNPRNSSVNLVSSPLYAAVKSKNNYAFGKLLKFETDFNRVDDDGNTLLMHAAMTGDEIIFDLLLAKYEEQPDFNLFQENKNSKSVLDLALEASATSIAQKIKSKMANIYYRANVKPILDDIKETNTIADCKGILIRLDKVDANLLSEKRKQEVNNGRQRLQNKICWLSDAEIEKAISQAKLDKYYGDAIRRMQAAIENYPDASNLDKARQCLGQLQVLLQAEIERQERIKVLKEKVNRMTQSELQTEIHSFINSWLNDMKHDRSTSSYWEVPTLGKTLYSLQSWEILIPDRYLAFNNEIKILISSSTKGGFPIRQNWKVFITRNDDMELKILSLRE